MVELCALFVSAHSHLFALMSATNWLCALTHSRAMCSHHFRLKFCLKKSVCLSVGHVLLVCLLFRLTAYRSVNLSDCSSVCPSIYLSNHPSVCLYICCFVHLPIQLSVRPSIRQFVYICLSVCLSYCAYVCQLSVCMSVYIWTQTP